MTDVAEKSKPKSFVRRDKLRGIEVEVQKKWDELKASEAERAVDENGNEKPKFMVTFPYPYMNGRLHLGHAFSLTKAEFTARYQRLQGKNVLFPFGFHCTGMPIQAAANKLRDEITRYGSPPIFPAEETTVEEAEPAEEKSAEAAIAAKSKGKKSKLVAKGNTAAARQWNIVKSCDVPEEEIPQFVDPLKWLEYFPPYGAEDLKAFGCAIDWRRSFITTSVNRFYDAFIRWQFNHLREGNKIKFGKRPAVFSILDGQVCADHDRASGENVGPQEYTIIKLKVLDPYPAASKLNGSVVAGRNMYLAPATLRPETMYGQTNCFVLPEGDYGCFETTDGDVLIVSHRAARGLSYQGILKEWGQSPSLLDVKGTDLIGLPLKAPNATYERVYTLPLMTISMGKGTGVVTSVPSDAPDDFAALRELKEKPLWREKFGITAEMVEPFEVVPIIEIEGYGNMSAVTMCERLDIKSYKDTEKLKLAKEEVYLKGYYEGIMIVGECIGLKVCDAKPIIRQSMINAGDALPYFEPENLVMSRSGDECIVAMTDQWYLSYGEAEWQKTVLDHIHGPNFNAYNEKIREKFDMVLGWLKEWACSRQFGLGTLLPWDQKWVIESLSDSTVYMAYYTIAHYFHGSVDNLSGSSSPYGLSPEQFTDEVFDYIFLGRSLPSGCAVPEELLSKMRAEFEYWYPMDLRVSAKDLIPNHLTMSLYNHVEIWKDRPELWPRGIYCNGHIMVDAEKMSKSKGNFLMLLQCVQEYSADATRFALADAGDTMEDANFDRSVANQAISYLYNEEEWVQTVIEDFKTSKLRDGPFVFMDRAFMNEMDYLIEATAAEFDAMRFRDGIHRCWFDMLIARDLYRDWSTQCEIPMHKDVVFRFIEIIALMMSPICPHWCEHIWALIGRDGLICQGSWPRYEPFDKLMRKQYIFFREAIKNARQVALKSKAASPRSAYIYLASAFDEKKKEVLRFLARHCTSTGEFPAELLKLMKEYVKSSPELKADTKFLMQFGAFMRDEAKERGPDALAVEQPFDQQAILEENKVYIQRALGLNDIGIYYTDDASAPKPGKKNLDSCIPGKPEFHIFSV